MRKLMRRLRTNAPLSAPIRLVQQRNPKCGRDTVLGYMAWRAKNGRATSFRIVVEERLPLGEKFEVVVHEYAHAIDRDTRPRMVKDCHDARWGQCYSRAFKASKP